MRLYHNVLVVISTKHSDYRPVIKKKISNLIIATVEDLVSKDNSILDAALDTSAEVSKIKRRAYKIVLNSFRREHVLRYIKDLISYTLPRKG